MKQRFSLIRKGYEPTEILEPVGYDGFSSKIVRNQTRHGISAEYSETDLEFDCEASAIIREAYQNEGLDAEITLLVETTCDGEEWEEEYKGILDFLVYSDNEERYRYVKCKTGDISAMTTFNNRFSEQVFINAATGMDGATIPKYSNLEKEITIPSKEILLKSTFKNPTEGEQTYAIWEDANIKEHRTLFISPGLRSDINEIPDTNETYVDLFDVNDGYTSADPLLIIDNSKLKFNEITIEWSVYSVGFDNNSLGDTYAFVIVKSDKNGNYTKLVRNGIPMQITNWYSGSGSYTVQVENGDRIFVGCEVVVGPRPKISPIYKQSGVFDVSVKALSTLKDTTAKVSLIHEVLSHTTEFITNGELTVKSDWYGRSDSEVNATSGNAGGGSLRCITNGLRIRNAVLTDGSEGFYSVSMDDLFKGLNPIDNIGLGFSRENGKLFVRIEPYRWFYKDDIILTINNPSSKVRKPDLNEIYSRVKVGYKKYTDINDTNGLDAYMTERGYSTKIKAIDKEMDLLSTFVADPYAIEYTRRMSIEKDSKDWKYDNDIFIICLKAETFILGGLGKYYVDTGITDSDGTVVSPGTLYNARISPARNARRWSDRLLNFTGSSKLHLMSAIGNAKAKGKANSTWKVQVGSISTFYIYSDDPQIVIDESQDISRAKTPLLKPETLSIEHALSREEYKKIKDNPYGIIVVDGEHCFLKEIDYKHKDGSCNITLIPRFDD